MRYPRPRDERAFVSRIRLLLPAGRGRLPDFGLTGTGRDAERADDGEEERRAPSRPEPELEPDERRTRFTSLISSYRSGYETRSIQNRRTEWCPVTVY